MRFVALSIFIVMSFFVSGSDTVTEGIVVKEKEIKPKENPLFLKPVLQSGGPGEESLQYCCPSVSLSGIFKILARSEVLDGIYKNGSYLALPDPKTPGLGECLKLSIKANKEGVIEEWKVEGDLTGEWLKFLSPHIASNGEGETLAFLVFPKKEEYSTWISFTLDTCLLRQKIFLNRSVRSP